MIPADWPSGVARASPACPIPTARCPGRATWCLSSATTGRPTSSSSALTTPGRPTLLRQLFAPIDRKTSARNNTVDVNCDRPYGKYVQIYQNPQSVGSGGFSALNFRCAIGWNSTGTTSVTAQQRHAHTGPRDPVQGVHQRGATSTGTCMSTRNVRKIAPERRLRPVSVGQRRVLGVAVPRWVRRPARIIPGPVPGRRGPEAAYGVCQATYEFVGPDEASSLARGTSCRSTAAMGVQAGALDFAGTGMKKGDRIRGLVGWEFHGEPAIQAWRSWRRIALHGGTEPVPTRRRSTRRSTAASFQHLSTIFWSFG